MTSYGGDPTVQFVEIRMELAGQVFPAHSVLAAFDSSGNYIADVLEVPGNITTGVAGGHWIMGTSQFATVSGLTPDFIIPATLPSPAGMLCWGGGGGVLPANPPTWSRTTFTNYVDCIAYGGYTGPSNSRTGTPISIDAVGHSLRRISNAFNNATAFACADPANPTNDAASSVNLPATTMCPPIPTPTAVPTATPSPAPSMPAAPPWLLSLFTIALLVGGALILWQGRDSLRRRR